MDVVFEVGKSAVIDRHELYYSIMISQIQKMIMLDVLKT